MRKTPLGTAIRFIYNLYIYLSLPRQAYYEAINYLFVIGIHSAVILKYLKPYSIRQKVFRTLEKLNYIYIYQGATKIFDR